MGLLDADPTRPYETGELATTVAASSSWEPSSLLSIGAKSIWAGGRDQTIIGTTSAGIGMMGTGDFLESRVADICTRLPPPPIPPWLENSPDRLRHLISNYSCWERYAELCSINIPYMKSSSRTQIEDSHGNDGMEDATMSRLLPFLAAILVGLLMVGVVAGAYFWHQRKRRKFSFTAKYMKQQPSPTRDYCSPNFYMTPSVTVETQLSLCALVDDNFLFQPYSIYKEEAWPYNNVFDASTSNPSSSSTSTKARSNIAAADSSVYETLSDPSGLRGRNNEILLQPDQLVDEHDQEQFYPSTQTLFRDSVRSTHSIPIQSDRNSSTRIKPGSKDSANKKQSKRTRKDKQKYASLHPSCQTPMLLHQPDSNSPYIQIQSLHDFPDSSNDECQSSSSTQLNRNENPSKRKGVMVGAMRKCKDVGNKVMTKLPWKNTIGRSSASKHVTSSSSPSSSSPSSSTSNRRLDRPIRALRQSLKGLRGSISHRRLHYSSPQKTNNSSNVDAGLAVPSSDDDHC